MSDEIVKIVIVSTYVWNNNIKRQELAEKGEAVFHGFGINFEAFESGPGHFSTAIA